MAESSDLPRLPSGTVTFLFTDIEGSTRLWQTDADAMPVAHARHDALLEAAITAHGGHIFKTVGDAYCAAFPTAPAAVLAALEAQHGLAAEPWPTTVPLRARIALHTGTVEPALQDDYRSPVLNRIARLLSAGHGGQTLVSAATQELIRDHLPPGCALQDLGEHRLKDLFRPEHIFQLDVPDLPTEFPPLHTLDRLPHNLPILPTPFVGREHDVRQVSALLQRADIRLLTLTGPGGTGKTRLALQAAADALDAFPDGTYFVPLAPISDPALVAGTVALALGVRDTADRPVQTSVIDAVAERQLLLVLDNFEQVVDAAELVAALIAACPNLTVLVTSRVRLRLYGEHELAVPPLAVPDPSHLPPLERLTQYDAVRLFIERAQAAQTSFTVTNANAPAVAAICAQLDGLPLAIELAAARVKLLPPNALLARLEQRLRVLTGGARDLPARQQTLRGTIAWSHDLLARDEQTLFRRMAVFSGGFSFAGAEAIAGDAAGDELELDIFDGLDRLVDQSLLRQIEVAGEPRFMMLETIREFGLEQLTGSGETEAVRARHAAYFLALAEEAEPALWGGADQVAWLDRLERERDNLRAALTWASDHEPATAARLGAALWRFWIIRGPVSEGRTRLEHILTASGDRLDPTVRALLLHGAGMLPIMQGDFARARSLLTEGLELTRSHGNAHGTARMLHGLGHASFYEGDVARGGELYAEALAFYREVDDAWGVLAMVNYLGNVARTRGDIVRAAELNEEALALSERLGNERTAALVRLNMGMTAIAQDDVSHASKRLADALARGVALGDIYVIAGSLAGLASVAERRGQPLTAARLLGAIDAHSERAGLALQQIERALFDRTEATLLHQLGEPSFAAAFGAGRALSLEDAIAEATAVEVPTDA